jgi:1,2-diacylglycerol 3-alpha-glucosyltransferase
MRLALLGAFAFPAPQGSQVYARDQALALREAGAEVSVVCYGASGGPVPAGLEVLRIPRTLSPRGFHSGPRLEKPIADLALAYRLLALHRERGFDALLAHNAEAAGVALAARALGGPPVVYVAHTLLEEELSAYAPARWRRACDAFGRRLDARIARHVSATIALGEFAARRLAAHASGPVCVIPPGIALEPAPDPAQVDEACEQHGLTRDRFALYAGNLDAYQEPAVLRELASRIAPHPLVVVTHGAPPRDVAPLRVLQVSRSQARPLLFGAAVALATRARRGGFPIKLLNYMEAGRAIVARAGQVDGLVHDQSAWLVPERAEAEAFAHATRTLLDEPQRGASLGRAARALAQRRHAWPELAARTLDLVTRVARLPARPALAAPDEPAARRESS